MLNNEVIGQQDIWNRLKAVLHACFYGSFWVRLEFIDFMREK